MPRHRVRVAPGEEEAVVAYLRAREQPTLVYRETVKTIELLPGERARDPAMRVRALCFVVDRRHPQYGRGLGFAEQVELVLAGVGRSGTAADYLEDMVACLDRLGIRDRRLLRLAEAVRECVRKKKPAAGETLMLAGGL